MAVCRLNSVGAQMEREQMEASLDPLALFRAWMKDAEATEPNDPNAVALATATAGGAPSVRMVLMKRLDERGFTFFTNAESRKGVELQQNPRAAMCFHWKSLRRQVRIEGVVIGLPEAEADEYFHARSRMSQLGAVASQQSRPLESLEMLEALVRLCDARFPIEIPRPGYWKGFVLEPGRIEFWADGANRLHDRFLFVRNESEWVKGRLFP